MTSHIDPPPRMGAPELLSELLRNHDEFARGGWLEPIAGALQTRYRRVAALAKALELGTPRSVAEGAFLNQRLSGGRAGVLVEIARTVSDTGTASFPVETYRRLLSHRLHAERVIGFNRSVLECSIPVLAGVLQAQQHVGESLRESLRLIDGWLCRLLDPEGKSFAGSELVATFGWPDVDVREQEIREAWDE